MIFVGFLRLGGGTWISHVQMVRIKPLSEKTNLRMLFRIFSKPSCTRDILKDLAPVFPIETLRLDKPQHRSLGL